MQVLMNQSKKPHFTLQLKPGEPMAFPGGGVVTAFLDRHADRDDAQSIRLQLEIHGVHFVSAGLPEGLGSRPFFFGWAVSHETSHYTDMGAIAALDIDFH